MNTIKILQTGRSQTVRIPKDFRFTATTLHIRKCGNGVLLTPVKKYDWDDFFTNYACPDFEISRTTAQKIQAREFF